MQRLQVAYSIQSTEDSGPELPKSIEKLVGDVLIVNRRSSCLSDLGIASPSTPGGELIGAA